MNIFLVFAVLGSWIAIFVSASGTLMQNGLNSMKYFTVLSNLLEGFASVVWLVSSHKNGKASSQAELLKYIAAAAVGLTCVVVLTFLGPLYGYPSRMDGISRPFRRKRKRFHRFSDTDHAAEQPLSPDGLPTGLHPASEDSLGPPGGTGGLVAGLPQRSHPDHFPAAFHLRAGRGEL